MTIEDRTHLARPGETAFIVTGSIGPTFKPQTFSSKPDAMHYARAIIRAGKDLNVWPTYRVVIEPRREV